MLILINLAFHNTIQQLYRKLTNAHDVIILLDFTICVIQPIISVLCLSETSLSRSFPTFGNATMREYGWHCIPPQLPFAICSLIFKLVLFKVLLRSVSNTVIHSLTMHNIRGILSVTLDPEKQVTFIDG